MYDVKVLRAIFDALKEHRLNRDKEFEDIGVKPMVTIGGPEYFIEANKDVPDPKIVKRSKIRTFEQMVKLHQDPNYLPWVHYPGDEVEGEKL